MMIDWNIACKNQSAITQTNMPYNHPYYDRWIDTAPSIYTFNHTHSFYSFIFHLPLFLFSYLSHVNIRPKIKNSACWLTIKKHRNAATDIVHGNPTTPIIQPARTGPTNSLKDWKGMSLLCWCKGHLIWVWWCTQHQWLGMGMFMYEKLGLLMMFARKYKFHSWSSWHICKY